MDIFETVKKGETMEKKESVAKKLCNSIRTAFLEYLYSDDAVEDAECMEALFAAIRRVEEELRSCEEAIEIQKNEIKHYKENAARAESNAGVIHCGDCKHANIIHYDDDVKECLWHCELLDQDVYDCEFCSSAEKKTD